MAKFHASVSHDLLHRCPHGAGSEYWLCMERELRQPDLVLVEDELVVEIMPLQNFLGREIITSLWMVCPTLAD